MNKKEVQQRVLQDGKPLALNKFEWDEKTNTFSSYENDLVLDFNGMINCTFKTGYECTFYTGSGCTFNTDEECVVVRRDIFEVITLEKNKIIKLNDYGIRGFTIVSPVVEETITIGGIKYSKKEVEERLKDLKEIK